MYVCITVELPTRTLYLRWKKIIKESEFMKQNRGTWDMNMETL